MATPDTLQSLRDAVSREQAALAFMDNLYCEFIVKMLNYQTEKGEAPTLDEFAAWRDSVDQRIEFSRQRGQIWRIELGSERQHWERPSTQ